MVEKDGDVGIFYIWDSYQWEMTQATLRLRVATHESWYETTDGLNNVVDPWFVGSTKQELYRRMSCQLKKNLDEAEKNLKNARRNLRRFKKYNPNR